MKKEKKASTGVKPEEKHEKQHTFIVVVLSCIFAVGLIFGGFFAYSHLVYHRSGMATVVEMVLKVYGKNMMKTEEAAKDYVRSMRRGRDYLYELPSLNYQSSPSSYIENDIQILEFMGSEEPQQTVLYIHGGGYVNAITPFHVSFCDILASKLNARVLVPLYPRAPRHTYEETYRIISEIYMTEREKTDDLTVMGDSAGGGFAVAFCQYLAENELPQADHLVGISPWLDLTMSGTGYETLDQIDPLLGTAGLPVLGRAWAGDADMTSYQLSPMFGEADGLPETLLLVGTRELFYADVVPFAEKLNEKGIPVTLIIGEGMNHVYPILPIPESEEAMQQICDAIRKE